SEDRLASKLYYIKTLFHVFAPCAVGVTSKTLNTANSNISMSEVTATPSQAPDSGLTLLAFGVMSFILILIVVMGVLVTAINLRGRCRNTKQHESCSTTSNFEKESITLVSVRTINTENSKYMPSLVIL
uniref:Endothelial cell-specific chemotaxis regulator n=1 Tax=Cyprinus carpio TaxID=7962 RepID=A0A8C1S4N5_CYPCA